MKKFLIILAVIAVIATGAYFIFRKKKCSDCLNKKNETNPKDKSEPVNTGSGNSQGGTTARPHPDAVIDESYLIRDDSVDLMA